MEINPPKLLENHKTAFLCSEMLKLDHFCLEEYNVIVKMKII